VTNKNAYNKSKTAAGHLVRTKFGIMTHLDPLYPIGC